MLNLCYFSPCFDQSLVALSSLIRYKVVCASLSVYFLHRAVAQWPLRRKETTMAAALRYYKGLTWTYRLESVRSNQSPHHTESQAEMVWISFS